MLRSIGGSVVLYPRYDNSSLNYHQVMSYPKTNIVIGFFCDARRHGAYVGRTGGQIRACTLRCFTECILSYRPHFDFAHL